MARIKLPAIIFGAGKPTTFTNWAELWPCCDCCRTPCPPLVGAMGTFPRAWCYDPQDGDWAGNVFPGGPFNPALTGLFQWIGYVTPLTLTGGTGDSIWGGGVASFDKPTPSPYNGGGRLWYNFCSQPITSPGASRVPCGPNAPNAYPCDSWILNLYDGAGKSYDFTASTPGMMSFWGVSGVAKPPPAGVPASVALAPINSNGNTTDICQNCFCPGVAVPLKLFATFSKVLFHIVIPNFPVPLDVTLPAGAMNNLFGIDAVLLPVMQLDYCPPGTSVPLCYPNNPSSGIWASQKTPIQWISHFAPGLQPTTVTIQVIFWYDCTIKAGQLFLRLDDLTIGSSAPFCIGNWDGVPQDQNMPMSAGGCSQITFNWSYNFAAGENPLFGFTTEFARFFLGSKGKVTLSP